MSDQTPEKTIAIIVSSGWAVRTFLQTGVLPELLSHARVWILASPELVDSLRHTLGTSVAVESLRPFEPMQGDYGRSYERRNHYFREWSSTSARQAKLRRYRETLQGRTRRLMRSYFLQAEAKLFTTKSTLSFLSKRESGLFFRDYGDVAYYEDLLRKYNPDLVVSTVPHVPEEAPPILIAQRRGIKTACWVNSWDNLTTKPAYFASYDLYMVWSNRMRWELLQYYPEAAGRRIAVTGVPHFDWYHASDLLLSRESFCEGLGLDPDRPIILYAMATPHLAPSETEVAKHLISDLQALKSTAKPQLILRLHPADGGERLVNTDFGDSVRVQVPGAKGAGSIAGFYPSKAENQEFVNSVFHANVVINLASTITIDAALCDRPVISVAYDPDPNRPHQKWIDRYHTDYEHYQTVIKCGAARLARSSDELMALIETYLEDPELDQAGRRRLVELWCGPNDGQAGGRVAATLLDVMTGEQREFRSQPMSESCRAS